MKKISRYFKNCHIGLLIMGSFVTVSLCGESVHSEGPAPVVDFWEQFQAEVLEEASLAAGTPRLSQILDEGEQLILKHCQHRFACLAAYRLAVQFYQDRQYAESIRACELALSFDETQSGNHLFAWNLIAESYKSLGDYPGSISASEALLAMDGPSPMKEDLYQMALVRKADLLLQDEAPTQEERMIAESILRPVTDFDQTGPLNDYKGQLIRARILNLKDAGELDQAMELAEDFVHHFPCDPWSPIIAVDTCKFYSHVASWEDLQGWLGFFSNSDCSPSAGLANLKLDLMSAYARVGMFDQATEIGEELKHFEKQKGDPVGWHTPHQESVHSITAISTGEVEREATRSIQSTQKEGHQKRLRVVYALLGLVVVGGPVGTLIARRQSR